jgi:hypothetical protein
MRKATHPSSGVGSSNPHHWRSEQLCHHGDGFCKVVCVFCAVSQLMTPQSGSLYVKNVQQHNLKMRLMVLLFAPHWLAPYPLLSKINRAVTEKTHYDKFCAWVRWEEYCLFAGCGDIFMDNQA